MRKLAFALFLAASGNLLAQTGNSYVKDGDTKTINGIECVLVIHGTFMMGSQSGEDGRNSDETQHQVTITQDYWISKYPITQTQYRSVTGSNPSYFSGDNRPVESVSWIAANSFAQKIGGRLPTEAEWEFAARGGNKSQGYIYSGSNTVRNVAWYNSNSGGQTQPVGQKQPNELGIYDMSGNVYEWCSDWYAEYSTGAVTNPTGATGISRVLRGGNGNGNSRYCRVACRDDRGPSYSDLSTGFRVVFPRN